VKAWEEAIVIDPKLSGPYNDLGIHYCHVGEYTKGLQCYDKAIELDPDNPDYLFNMAQAYLTIFPEVQRYREMGQGQGLPERNETVEEGREALSGRLRTRQDYAMNFYAAENFDVKPNWKEAAEAWQHARDLARNDAERFNAWLNEGRVRIKSGETAEARTCIEEALKIQPKSPAAERLLEGLAAEPSPQKQPAKTNIKNPSSQ